ncbi:MAG: hypothetical protein R3Y36_03535 [Spirochaetales bacterium]
MDSQDVFDDMNAKKQAVQEEQQRINNACGECDPEALKATLGQADSNTVNANEPVQTQEEKAESSGSAVNTMKNALNKGTKAINSADVTVRSISASARKVSNIINSITRLFK